MFRYQVENNFGIVNLWSIVAIDCSLHSDGWRIEIYLRNGDYIGIDGIKKKENAMRQIECFEEALCQLC